jgi:hypothetical protein
MKHALNQSEAEDLLEKKEKRIKLIFQSFCVSEKFQNSV